MRKDGTHLRNQISNFDTLPDSAHVASFVVAAILGCVDATVWRRAAAGQIPAPKKLGPRSTKWNVGELRRYLAAQ